MVERRPQGGLRETVGERSTDLKSLARGRVNVLSIFNGIACPVEALRRLGLPLGDVHVCELEEVVNKISAKNFKQIRTDVMPANAWHVTKEHVRRCGPIHMFFGSAPCVDFSRAKVDRLSGVDGRKGRKGEEETSSGG